MEGRELGSVSFVISLPILLPCLTYPHPQPCPRLSALLAPPPSEPSPSPSDCVIIEEEEQEEEPQHQSNETATIITGERMGGVGTLHRSPHAGAQGFILRRKNSHILSFCKPVILLIDGNSFPESSPFMKFEPPYYALPSFAPPPICTGRRGPCLGTAPSWCKGAGWEEDGRGDSTGSYQGQCFRRCHGCGFRCGACVLLTRRGWNMGGCLRSEESLTCNQQRDYLPPSRSFATRCSHHWRCQGGATGWQAGSTGGSSHPGSRPCRPSYDPRTAYYRHRRPAGVLHGHTRRRSRQEEVIWRGGGMQQSVGECAVHTTTILLVQV